MSCATCCGSSTGNGEQNTIVVSNCCGLPDPGEDGAHFRAVLSLGDITTPQQITLFPMGEAGSLAPPSGTQRLYIFSYQIVVGIAGTLNLYEGIDGDSSFPGDFALIAGGFLAQHGGMLQRVPNSFLRLGNTLHASHSAVGQVDIIVVGKLVTES